MIDEYQDAQDEQGPGPGWVQPGNGGHVSPLGPGRPHSMQTRSPQLAPLNAGGPSVQAMNAGGAAFFAPAAGPSENANGASAFAMGDTSRGNGGSPNVVHTPYSGPFGNYTGSSRQGPHQVGISTRPAQVTTPTQGAALQSFIASHQQGQQGGGQQGQQGGGHQQGQSANEAEANTTEGAGEAAGLEGAAGAGGAAEGVEMAMMLL